jgi:hypothetical protein
MTRLVAKTGLLAVQVALQAYCLGSDEPSLHLSMIPALLGGAAAACRISDEMFRLLTETGAGQ